MYAYVRTRVCVCVVSLAWTATELLSCKSFNQMFRCPFAIISDKSQERAKLANSRENEIGDKNVISAVRMTVIFGDMSLFSLSSNGRKRRMKIFYFDCYLIS